MIHCKQEQSLARKQQVTFTISNKTIEPGELEAKHILTPEQLADCLKVPVSWVYDQTRSRATTHSDDPLPTIRMGKYLRFYWPEVEKWLERRQGG
ncbi:MAG TPA: helix-turn-helix domain-containing protein [Candidatus Dormibacteraeota bacterium]|nr:helix-turn-helix domain-containing protein [Candidatus Dormibacteraeota bacterium]